MKIQEVNKKCKMYGQKCDNFVNVEGCTTGCNYYNPKNLDEVLGLPDEILTEEKPDIILGLSDLPKFDKNFEFFVAKKNVFIMQSVSPKKIILKYKRKLKESDSLTDGCYTFKDQKGKLLEPLKVFRKFDREAEIKTAKIKALDEEALRTSRSLENCRTS